MQTSRVFYAILGKKEQSDCDKSSYNLSADR